MHLKEIKISKMIKVRSKKAIGKTKITKIVDSMEQ
jgi:hypothetical protein